MSGIFLSYRRDDAASDAGRIYDRLSGHFGREQLFMDIDTIELGVDFVEVINEKVGSCDVLIAVVGKNWMESKDSEGTRRLENPADFVRLEIAAALERKIRIIPALVGGATMPGKNLPKALAGLARRQAIEISHVRFHQDVDTLITALGKTISAGGETWEAIQRTPGGTPRKPEVETEPDPEAVVTDARTGLMWTRNDNGQDIDWPGANEYAKKLGLGGYTDWRLPTIEELERLYDPKDGGEYNIRKPFRLSNWWVWSSTKMRVDSESPSTRKMRYFSFHGGKRYHSPVGDLSGTRALCVRRMILSGSQWRSMTESEKTTTSQTGQLNKPFFRQDLAITEKVPGPEHPDTAAILNNQATLLYAKGDYEGAEPLFRRALAIHDEDLGPEHPTTANTRIGLALLLQDKGDYEEAEPLFRRALAIREKVSGPEHPHTAICLSYLARLLQDKGDYEGAEPLFRRALAIHEEELGPEHPTTANSRIGLALQLQDKGDYEGAEPFLRQALAIYEKVFGPEHPTTANIRNNLASIVKAKGDL